MSLLLLTGLSLTYSNASRPLERIRRAVTQNTTPDFLGVWTFAAVVLLPPSLLLAALGLFYVADLPARLAAEKPHLWRHAYGCFAASVAALVAAHMLSRYGWTVGLPLAVVTFTAVNIGLISLAIIVRRQLPALRMLANPRSHMLEVATQLTGVVLGASMQWHQAAALIALPVIAAIHYRATGDSVDRSEAFDKVTGLWAEWAWTFRAEELIGAGEIVTVLVIDSHTADQKVLADVLRPCLDDDALFGYYGDAQMVSISTTGALTVGEETTQRAARTLSRSGAGFAVGSRTSRCEDVTEMLGHALADLMDARERVQITRRPH